MEHVLAIDQFDGKPELPKAFSSLASDAASDILFVDAMDFDEAETRVSVMGLPDEMEVKVRVCRPDVVFRPSPGRWGDPSDLISVLRRAFPTDPLRIRRISSIARRAELFIQTSFFMVVDFHSEVIRVFHRELTHL